MTRAALGIALFCAGFALAGSAQAQVYKCVDAAGKTVYSQSPCPGNAKSTTISRSAPPPSAPPAADKNGKPLTPADREMQERLKASKKGDEAKKAAEDEQRASQMAENCRRAKEQLAAYEMGGRISRIKDGERYYLTDDEIAREKAGAQAAVGQNCK